MKLIWGHGIKPLSSEAVRFWTLVFASMASFPDVDSVFSHKHRKSHLVGAKNESHFRL